MKIGTKSVLFGAHCFLLHPWFVARAWTKLYGFPFDPRLWVAFFVHDIGYLGKPNMDGPEGERHVELGAKIMASLFGQKWGEFALYHSRYYAKAAGHPVSRLCFADKMAFPLTPAWLYLPMVSATGEIYEYLKNAQKSDSGHWTPTGYDKRRWHTQLREYMTKWVETHKDGGPDTWTDATRNARKEGACQQSI
jgi:hypothetical protein